MPQVIDVRHRGRPEVIAAHLVRGLIVDPGPASALENWVDSLEDEPRGLLLTHIHLDHAGATGVLVRRFPHLRVYVSEVGAPHLVDPTRLIASAGRLYGAELMEGLWGEIAPVPAERVVALGGGERVEGFRVERTPGHASHHLCFLDLEQGDAYVGDMAGVRVPPGRFTLAPMPPPEIEIEAWLRSVDAIEALRPQRLRLTHFGLAEDVGAQLDRVRASLRRESERARRGDREAFLAALEAEIDAAAHPRAAASLREVIPPEQLWLGLDRYWRTRGREGDEIV